MVRKKYTEERIIAMLREGEAGTGVSDLYQKYGIATPHTTTGRRSMPISPSVS